MRWSRLAFAGIAATAAGCLLPELGDFAGTGARDGGLTSDAATSDGAATDAGVPEARSCPDGAFCDDFDDGPLGAKWAAKQEIDGLLSLVDAGVSAPNALQLQFFPPTKNERRASLSTSFKIGGATHVVCSLHVKPVVRTASPGDDYQLVLVNQIASSSSWESVYIKLTPTATDLLEDHVGTDGGIVTTVKGLPTTAGGVATGAWSTVVLDADYAKKTAKLTVTGTTTASLDLPTLFPPTTPSSLQIVLGDDGDTDQEVSTTLFDDLVCTF